MNVKTADLLQMIPAPGGWVARYSVDGVKFAEDPVIAWAITATGEPVGIVATKCCLRIAETCADEVAYERVKGSDQAPGK